jgi:hypothetical protein
LIQRILDRHLFLNQNYFMANPTLEFAAQCAQNYRGSLSNYAKSFFIEKSVIEDLLAQNGGDITGIRVYLGLDNAIQPVKLVAAAVATTGANDDDFDIPEKATDPTNAIIAETRPCPIHCPKPNALNS